MKEFIELLEKKDNGIGHIDKIPNFKIPEYFDGKHQEEDFSSLDTSKIPNFNTSEFRQLSFLPCNNGTWDGKPGDSTWSPNPEHIPKSSNPDDKTWSEILKTYNINGIPFKDGYPDFSAIAKVSVEIDDFSENRNSNFNQADNKTAEKWNAEGKEGRADWKASEVKQYRKDNNLTWHECEDTKTLQLVPSEVHNNIPHSGGISVAKKENNETSEVNA